MNLLLRILVLGPARIIPVVLVIALVAGIIYVVMTARTSPERAKEVVIAFFTWVFVALAAFFALASLYALAEHNDAVLDLAISFVIVALVGLGITRLCNRRFLKNHPHYIPKRTGRAKTKRRFPWGK